MSRKRKDASIRAVAGPEEPLWVRYAPRTAKELKVYGPTVAKVRDWLRKATSRARLEPGCVTTPAPGRRQPRAS